ncbi:MAG: hypothetical protein AB1714_06045 [Acidobacteriota bacterium]
MDEEHSLKADPPVERKAYSKPELVEYGKVNMMTLGGTYPQIEGGIYTSG